jgi:hypothetical protein
VLESFGGAGGFACHGPVQEGFNKRLKQRSGGTV